MVEDGEVKVRRFAFRAAHRVGAVVLSFDASDDVGQTVDDGFDSRLMVRGYNPLHGLAAAHQNGPLVGDLADNQRADDLRRRFGDAILSPAQEDVAAHRPFHAGLKAARTV